MMGSAQQIDGKYDVLALEEQGEGLSRYRVFAAGRLEPLTLDWFEISSSAQRSAFHRYRGALRALAPAGLVDVVARPGAYYALWQPLDGQPLAEFLALPVRDEAAVRGLHDLSAQLAEQGFALGDAEVIFGSGGLPQLAHLSPAAHSPAEAQALSAEALAPLKQGRVRRQRAALSPLAVLPGALFLLAASYL
ncbi:MAG: PASTA domain-containing protein, partial [Deinococcus sp.]